MFLQYLRVSLKGLYFEYWWSPSPPIRPFVPTSLRPLPHCFWKIREASQRVQSLQVINPEGTCIFETPFCLNETWGCSWLSFCLKRTTTTTTSEWSSRLLSAPSPVASMKREPCYLFTHATKLYQVKSVTTWVHWVLSTHNSEIFTFNFLTLENLT